MAVQTVEPDRRPAAASPGPERRQVVSVLVILALAFAMRLWALSWGLPHRWSLDEANKRDAALGGGLLPDLPGPQPGFLYNSLRVVYRVAESIFPTLDNPDHIYIGRLFIAVLGVLTVLAVWMLARELADSDRPSPAIPAALLLAVLPFHTAMSRYIKEDTPLGLMTGLVLLALVRYWKVPTWARLLLLGLAVGACFSTKFSAAAVLPVVGVAVLAVARRDGIRPKETIARVCGLGGAAIVGVLLVSPQYLVDPGLLWEGFKFQVFYSQEGHHDGVIISPWSQWWTYYIRNGLIPGMTWPVFLLAIGGAVPLLRRPAGWTVVASALVFYLILEESSAKPAPFPARYLTPVIPLLCVQAGFGIQAIRRRAADMGKPVLALVACALVFFVPPAVKSAMVADEAVHDTRWVAGAWMDTHLPPGTHIVLVDNHMYRPAAEGWGKHDIWKVEERGDTLDPSTSGDRPYFVLTSFRYQRYLDDPAADPRRTAYYRAVMRYPLVKRFEPKWLSYGFHSPTILIYRPGP
ncbi:MAG TPA: glycosyltransferase family 39 protein [Aeromicrobium sp.]|nr:glycosyltransferase family 39 protein [Aeromicrobium sp.]